MTRQKRLLLGLSAVLAAIIWVSALGIIFDSHVSLQALGVILLGTGSELLPFVSVQTLIWIVTFMSAVELWVRAHESQLEYAELDKHYLPEKEHQLLGDAELAFVAQNTREVLKVHNTVLPKMIQRVVFQYRSTQSIEQASSILNASLDLYAHEIELKYTLLRYLTWLIPTLGFIGTIIGISDSLNFVGLQGSSNIEALLDQVVQKLGVAFNTTLLALILSAVIIFFMNIIQAKEELVVNHCGQYCFDNLINRLYIQK